MAYIETSYLSKINPSIKLLIMLLMTILLTITYGLFIPIASIIFFYLGITILGKAKPFKLFLQMIPFIILGLSLTFFLQLANGFPVEGWRPNISIGLRIINFSLLSIGFVLTTEPKEFVMSLIQQVKLPYVIGYSFLTAYRFLPTFSDELKRIALAKEMRGEGNNRSYFATLKNLPKYLLPLLASAIRKGERVALAMDARGFRSYTQRNYYVIMKINKSDYLMLALVLVFMVISVVVAVYINDFAISLGLVT